MPTAHSPSDESASASSSHPDSVPTSPAPTRLAGTAIVPVVRLTEARGTDNKGTAVAAADEIHAARAQLPVSSAWGNHQAEGSGVPDSDALFPEQAFPKVGSEFLGFQLAEELGKGAFGRVYLAHQGTLAGRPVALKIACDIAGESRTLAQLQHTNIVPIYSYHRTESFQAVCMPYFGRTTLAQVIEHLSGRASLPSSGRELKSTLKRSTTQVTTPDSTWDTRAPKPITRSDDPPTPAGDPAGWARLESLSYVEAVLWLGLQLADGLAHAHARGILHRDLKPANVLLADDGRPMLLDFNLAEDVKQRTALTRAKVGGTLPYMAPEHLEAFRDQAGVVDERCDIYSLGIILFELLTGRHPFAIFKLGAPSEIIRQLIAERRQPPPGAAKWNPLVSAATEAIIRKCLAPDANDRYQRAEHLRDDLDRQLNNLPLKYAANPSTSERIRKWGRRHPRFTSSGTVAAVAAVLLMVLGIGVVQSRERAKDLHARTHFADHQSAFRDVRLYLDDRHLALPNLDESLAKLRAILTGYGVPEDGTDSWLASPDVARLSSADIARLRADIGEAFYQMAHIAHLKTEWEHAPGVDSPNLALALKWNAASEQYAGARLPRAIRMQRAALLELNREPENAARLRAEAKATPLEAPRDLFLLGASLNQRGKYGEALPRLEKSTLLDPSDFSAWFVCGEVHNKLGHNEMAIMCYTACIAIRDDFAQAWLNRGQTYSQLRQYKYAIADFDRVIHLDASNTEAYIQRAEARDRQSDLKHAEEDFTLALETGKAPVQVYFRRADVRDRLNDKAGAKADREKGLSLTPTDALSWVGHGETRLADDPKGALADTDEALKLNPSFVPALQLKAHILAERLNRPDEALAALNRAVELNEDYVPARAGRGVVLARRGKRDEAIRDAKDALLRDTLPPNLYQVACIYALTSAEGKGHPEDKREAFRLLWASLKTGFAHDIVGTDPDLNPLRKDPEFDRLVAGAKAFYEASQR
jgi:serine/threonine protein kinase/Flp pilus assembly protein TadD